MAKQKSTSEPSGKPCVSLLNQLKETWAKADAERRRHDRKIGALLYDAASLLVRLYEDASFRAKCNAFDDDKLATALNREIPAWIGYSFGDFHRMLQAFPDRTAWEAKDLRELREQAWSQPAAEQTPETPRRRHRPTIAEVEKLKTTVVEHKARETRLRDELTKYAADEKTAAERIRELERENNKLRARVRDLEAENADLRARLVEPLEVCTA